MSNDRDACCRCCFWRRFWADSDADVGPVAAGGLDEQETLALADDKARGTSGRRHRQGTWPTEEGEAGESRAGNRTIHQSWAAHESGGADDWVRSGLRLSGWLAFDEVDDNGAWTTAHSVDDCWDENCWLNDWLLLLRSVDEDNGWVRAEVEEMAQGCEMMALTDAGCCCWVLDVVFKDDDDVVVLWLLISKMEEVMSSVVWIVLVSVVTDVWTSGCMTCTRCPGNKQSSSAKWPDGSCCSITVAQRVWERTEWKKWNENLNE